MLTISQAAKKLKISRQAIYIAIRNTKKINATKVGKRYLIDPQEVLDYKKKKFLRKYSMFNGEILFNPEKGEISVTQAAKTFRMEPQRIYYLVRTKKIPSIRKKCALVLDIENVREYLKHYKKMKSRRKS